MKKSKEWQNLSKALPDIEEQIEADRIKVIRVKKNEKNPLGTDYYHKKTSLNKLKKHYGNFGIIVGYNSGKNGSSIAVVDIDGYTINKSDNIPMERKTEIKQTTKEFIYQKLKDALPDALVVRTQSGGYHFYIWNESEIKDLHGVSKSLTFPNDFEIAELRGKSLDRSIEIFNTFKTKQVILPTSSINGNSYEVISDLNKLGDMGTVSNIHENVKEALLKQGFGLNKPAKKKSKKVSKQNEHLKDLSKKEINSVVDLLTDKYELFSVIDGAKHEGALALGGYFNKHINRKSAKQIASGIIKKVPSHLFEYTGAFKKTILESYDRQLEEKVGLPTLLELIEDHSPDFNIEEFTDDLTAIIGGNTHKIKLNKPFTYNGKNYPIFIVKNEYYLIEKIQGIRLEYHKNLNYILIRKNGNSIAKLQLKKTVGSIEATDTNLRRFKLKLQKNSINMDAVDVLEELDLFFTDSKELNQTFQMGRTLTELKKNPKNSGALMDFSKNYLEETGRIAGAYNPDTKENEYYILNNSYFEKLNGSILQRFIEEEFGLRLPMESVKTLMGSLRADKTFHYEYFQFADNIYFNGVTGEFEKKPEGFLTDKKLGMKVNGKFKLYRRLTLEEIEEDTKENGYSPLENIVYTIMSTPGDEEESLRRYKGFLEFIGYIFRPVNTNKKMINLYGDGDDGKSTLLEILRRIIPEYSVIILADELDKGFTEPMIANKHVIGFDESSTEDLAKHENFLKNASNGLSNRSSRQIYSKESIDNLRFGLIFILSNAVIGLNTADEALMEREDIIKMHRRFKSDPDYEKGELKVRDDIDNILNNDFRGFERLVNLGIIEYNKSRHMKKFTLSTSITETQEIILGNDPLKRFLATKTRYDKTGATTNDLLTTTFIEWSKKQGIDLRKHFNFTNEKSLKGFIKRELGKRIKEHYKSVSDDDLVSTNDQRQKQYSIKILNNSEVEERNNTKYQINEKESFVLAAKSLRGVQKLVYDAVDKLGPVSLNTLLEETDVSEIELVKTLTNLDDHQYIEEI